MAVRGTSEIVVGTLYRTSWDHRERFLVVVGVWGCTGGRGGGGPLGSLTMFDNISRKMTAKRRARMTNVDRLSTDPSRLFFNHILSAKTATKPAGLLPGLSAAKGSTCFVNLPKRSPTRRQSTR